MIHLPARLQNTPQLELILKVNLVLYIPRSIERCAQ